MLDRTITLWIRTTVCIILLTITGCFGPPTLYNDIDAYNRAAVSSEESMLLYNIGRLYRERPPHFMMLQEVDQTRTFMASASFQWTDLWNSIGLPFVKHGAINNGNAISKGANTYQVGPFNAGTSESPLFKFIPIQGNDFAQRFESPLTDKFSLFLEDQRRYETRQKRSWLVKLFTQSLQLDHGDQRDCPEGHYFNRWPEKGEAAKPEYYYFDMFSKCVDSIADRLDLNFVQIDAGHLVPTNTGEPPKAADVVSALQAGYKWISPAGRSTTNQQSFTDERSTADEKPIGTKGKQTTSGKTTRTQNTTTNSNDFLLANPERIPAWMDWDPSVGPQTLTYGDQIVREIWPTPQDYFYLELRNGADTRTTERLCHTPTGGSTNSPDVVCGYFKIGNLLEIMLRLGTMTCADNDSDEKKRACIFGIGSSAPPWADSSASYVIRSRRGIDKTEAVWVPAHDPNTDADLAERDRYTFLMLYKLYQMSLVDTSKLVSGSTPITIGR